MLKTNILNDAKKAEQEADDFVEETKQLLLDASTKETAILSAAGLNSQSVQAVRLRNEKAMRRELKMKTGSVAVLNKAEIKALCLKYRLRFLRSHFYCGPIDALLGRKIVKFMEDAGEVNPAYAAENRLYVMAPVEAFTLKIGERPPDPILFYQCPNDVDLYCVVHKWGNDFTPLRRVEGWLTVNALRWRWFMFLSLSLSAILSAYWIPTSGAGPWWFAIPVVTMVFAIIRAITVCDNDHEAKLTFSESAWNNEQKTNKSLLWL